MNNLSNSEAIAAVTESVSAVAPDVEEELATLDRDVDLFEELDLDSMDHVNIMTGIWERTGIEIADRDYGQLRSLNALAQHLSAASV